MLKGKETFINESMYLKDYPFYAHVFYSCLTCGLSKKVQKNSNAAFQIFSIAHISTLLHSRIIILDSSHLVLYMLKVLKTHIWNSHRWLSGSAFWQYFYTHGKKNKRTNETTRKKEYTRKLFFSLFFAQKSDVTCCCDILSCFYLK